jgi:hypothetical protein
MHCAIPFHASVAAAGPCTASLVGSFINYVLTGVNANLTSFLRRCFYNILEDTQTDFLYVLLNISAKRRATLFSSSLRIAIDALDEKRLAHWCEFLE